MPRSPYRPCRVKGCGNLVEGGGWCEDHAEREAEARDMFRSRKPTDRKSSNARGYSSRWRMARAAFLLKNPLCVHCQREGRTTAATVVDHIQDHKGDMKIFWDFTNWQPLCQKCHGRKTFADNKDAIIGRPSRFASQFDAK